MSSREWDDEDPSYFLYASAHDEGRVYQSGRDQYIEVQENHYHLDVDRETEYEEETYYTGSDGHEGLLNGAVTCCLFILPPAPIVVVGSSLKVMFTVTPGPAIIWLILYTVVSFVASVKIGLHLLERALDRVPYPLGGEGLLLAFYALLGLALFVIFLMRDPAESGHIGDLGHLVVRTFGPV